MELLVRHARQTEIRVGKGRTYSRGHEKDAKEAKRGLLVTAKRSREVGGAGVEDERMDRNDGLYARTLVCYYL